MDQTLKKLKIKKKYIYIYARDENYLKKRFPEVDFTYHSYRNSDINKLRLLIIYASRNLGYEFVRVGSVSKNRINCIGDKDIKVIDYLFKFSQSKNDIDIISGCEIYINNGGGPSSIAVASGRNIITINHLSIRIGKKEILKLWIPKLILKKDNNKYLSFKNIEEIGLTSCNTIDYLRRDCNIVENSEEDILNIFLDYFKIKNNIFLIKRKI